MGGLAVYTGNTLRVRGNILLDEFPHTSGLKALGFSKFCQLLCHHGWARSFGFYVTKWHCVVTIGSMFNWIAYGGSCSVSTCTLLWFYMHSLDMKTLHDLFVPLKIVFVPVLTPVCHQHCHHPCPNCQNPNLHSFMQTMVYGFVGSVRCILLLYWFKIDTLISY